MKSRKFPAHDRAVREPERRQITGVPCSTWRELQDKGLAPRPYPIGNRCVAWSFNELTAWWEAAKAKRPETWRPFGEIATGIVEKVKP
jgi:predicted DNA-binding transcriptional regulator AlpA